MIRNLSYNSGFHIEDLDYIQKHLSKSESKPKLKKSELPVELDSLKAKSFFTHQIQVQPPEGLNATVAAPLTPGGGWAPSIPPSQSSYLKKSHKDLVLRAKSGIRSGDVQKEAHMSYSFAVIYENKLNYTEASHHYKKFFFCARVLEDPIGAALALNRLGVIYHNAKKYEKSLQFHLKHFEFADKQSRFAANYNLGISYRMLGNFSQSVSHFQKGLKLADRSLDLESQCISYGQLGVTYIELNDSENAISNLSVCVEIASRLKNQKINLDCLLSLAFLCYGVGKLEESSDYFHKAISTAKSMGENEVADKCSCNLGIVDAKRNFKSIQHLILSNCNLTQ